MLNKPLYGRRYLRSGEVAKLIGVSKVTLKEWLRSGKVPEPMTDPENGYRMWTGKDIEVLLNTVTATRARLRRSYVAAGY